MEPTVKELTKDEYEKAKGIGQRGTGDPGAGSIGEGLEENPGPGAEASVSPTKKILIEKLKERGYKAGELNRMRKDELMELL